MEPVWKLYNNIISIIIYYINILYTLINILIRSNIIIYMTNGHIHVHCTVHSIITL